jgi:bleomycin hydrolase
MKRTIENTEENYSNKRKKIDDDFLKICEKNFNENISNKIIKNSITNVGSLYVTTDHDEARKVSHIFLNSIKKKNLKATDQGGSGRCWLFSGLNIFRHLVIGALNLENFEFSETYLFFWDKFERSNSFLQWFSEYTQNKENIEDSDRFFDFLVDKEKWMSDGGYWNYFSNLVSKYGLIPKTAMPETVHSEYSSDMNDILMDILHSSSYEIMKNKDNKNKINNIIDKTLKNIYNVLVKFLGEPPKTFDWDFVNEENEPTIIQNLNPLSFKQLVLNDIDVSDFVVLVNIPSKKYKYYTKFEINNTNNVIEKEPCTLLNLPIHELKKYTQKSILKGIPVWFGADVNKHFNPLYSSLNEKLNKDEIVFNYESNMNKEFRFLIKNQETCHAMTITGVNIDNNNKSVNWQVENSWGFYDNEELGKDGFLCMTDKWFEEYVGQVVIHKKFLSRNILKLLEEEPIKLEPWESMAPAIKINSKRFYRYGILK